MKHLKSSVFELRQLFERSITLREIAEPLVSFDSNQTPGFVAAFMAERNFDLVGIRQEGLVAGYVRRSNLSEGTLLENLIPFQSGEVLSDGDSILSAMRLLASNHAVFVLHLGQVHGIITRGDLQKTPVRMWLFGLISMIEMQLLRLIRIAYPEDAWTGLLTAQRLMALRRIFTERHRRNEAIGLSDCLQLCDKAALVLKNPAFLKSLPFNGKAAGDRFFKKLEATRNALAHSQDIITGKWPGLAEQVLQAEEILYHLESFRPGPRAMESATSR